MEAVALRRRGEVDDWLEARDTLRQWQEEDPRKSLKATEFGTFLLKHRESDLGSEG